MNITKVSSTSGNILVIDSRLIAERLGIQHDSFIKTIETYKTQAEQAFGIFRFEVEKLDGRGRPSRFYLLTEDQATFIMSLSRNTPEVVQCKLDLVVAFSKAKSFLQAKQPYNLIWFDRLKLYRNKSKIPTGWFTIFEEMTIGLLADFEDAGYSLPDGSIPDISVGKCFCNHLRALGYSTEHDAGYVLGYKHWYPWNDFPVKANIYNIQLMGLYRQWFTDTYRTKYLPNYLKSKDPKALPSLRKMLGLPEGCD